MTPRERLLLCLYSDDVPAQSIDGDVSMLWSGDRSRFRLDSSAAEYASTRSADEALLAGAASLCEFVEANWTGPGSGSDPNADLAALSVDGEEVYPTIERPEALSNATTLLDGLPDDRLVYLWWKLRCHSTRLRTFDEITPSTASAIDDVAAKIRALEDDETDAYLKTVLNLEINQAYLALGRLKESKECLNKISEYSEFDLELRGALGKRTKHQQAPVAQLKLDPKRKSTRAMAPASETHSESCLPVPLKLSDDVRLENIEYLSLEDNEVSELNSLEQVICLNILQYVQRSQCKDSILKEELLPYVDLLLSQKHGPWVIRVNTLLTKCEMESKDKRTVERAMMQCEQIVNNLSKDQPKITSRLSYFWASGLPLKIQMNAQLADLLISIGLVKAALDLYLKLQLWENVIACYTILEMPQKAADIIKQELEKKETVKLYCLLGDATDDVNMYEKAWNFSNEKSARAQRHWGNYLFARRQYKECIPHYQKSCEINSLQESVWLRLGYAALSVHEWDIAATAYRRYTYLEPNSFEAWNNLGKVYVEQGNKKRAYKAFKEALKFNFENWQLWENVIVVSMATQNFDDIIQGYHRLLDLKKKHLDVEALSFLSAAVRNNAPDAEGNGAARLHPKVLELFGRVTSVHNNNAKVWESYAEITTDIITRGQRVLKACNCIMQQKYWWEECTVLRTKRYKLCHLLEYICFIISSIDKETSTNELLDLLSSGRLTCQTVIRVISKEKPELYEKELPDMILLLEIITDKLKQFVRKDKGQE